MYPVLIQPAEFINRSKSKKEALTSSRTNRKSIGNTKPLFHPENASDLVMTIRLNSRSSGTRPGGTQNRLNIYKNDPEFCSNVRKRGIADIELWGWKLHVKGESQHEV